jgi:aspartate/tyrosine/aromatic aminotransferase
VDFSGLLEDLEQAPENSVILLHMAAHNPTGSDLTQDQWVQVADVMEVCLSYITVPNIQTHTAHQKQNRGLEFRVLIFLKNIIHCTKHKVTAKKEDDKVST